MIACRAPIPRRRAVSITERTLAWSFAPQTDRKQLVTLRKTALGRSACSDALLVGATSGSVRKTNRVSCQRTKLRRNFSATAFPTIGVASMACSSRKCRQKKASSTPGPHLSTRRSRCRQTRLVLLAPTSLRSQAVGHPRGRPHTAQEPLHHILAAARRNGEVATVDVLEHPEPP